MRVRILAFCLVTTALAVAAPTEARHWHGPRVRLGVSVGWGGWYGPYGYWGPSYVAVPVAGAPARIGAVDTDVAPEHARVYLDGELLGSADDFDGLPGYLLLHPGRYALEFRLPGYRSLSVGLDVQPGALYRIDEKLERIPGEATLRWSDRPPKPHTGLVYGRAEAAAKENTRPFPDVSLRPELDRQGRDGTPRRALRAEAALDLAIAPGLASVYLDGEFIGTGGELAALERGVAVGAGPHTIEVMAPGFERRKVDVDLAPGERRKIEIELDREAVPVPAGPGHTP